MTAPLLRASGYHDHAHADTPMGKVVLDYTSRFLRRKVLTMEDGQPRLVDLAHTTSLNHDGVLLIQGGGEVLVQAAIEPLLAIIAPDLTRVAWHVGNRHTPCQIENGRLLIQPDHVIADMLMKLGATVTETHEPFTPEGGAYGHGRTHSHDHGHAHAH